MLSGMQVFGIVLLVILTIIFVVLVAIAAWWILSLAIGIVRAIFESRRDRANTIEMDVPGLGKYQSSDNRTWYGHTRGIHVSRYTDGGPPTESQAAMINAILDAMSSTAELGRQYLRDNEECEWLEGGAELFKPEMLDAEDEKNFEVTFGHPADSDGLYVVEFSNGLPVSSKRCD